MFARIANALNRRVFQWINYRVPSCSQATLSHREIFVLPTRWGLLFAGMVVLILLTGINFQNSMVLAVGMFLLSVTILSILTTYRNLAGLSLTFHRADPCFPGEKAGFEFSLNAHNSQFNNIELGWPPEQVSRVDLAANSNTSVVVECQSMQRGIFKPGRMLLTTTYPFGLIRAWSWQDLQAEALIYPKPLAGDINDFGYSSDSGKLTNHNLSGQEDFIGLKTHIAGEPLSRVAWKKYAQTGELFSKEFSQPVTDPDWIDFDAFPVTDDELKLSWMCFKLLELSQKGALFGLKMPGLTLPPQHGAQHTERCLTALALYPDHVATTL